MAETKNLTSRIEERLPAELAGFMQAVGAIAAYQGEHLYLVGGVVRDLLLGRANLDLDLVVDGNAVDLAQQAANITQGKLTVHRRFGTARLRWGKWSIDFAGARSETYDRPGALPRVKAGSLTDDLFRRDFTINAMAVRLNPGRYGDLIDVHHGREDLERKLVRILHDGSFTDDATRIWRALRYQQRLDFDLEADTRRLLARDVAMLDTISGDRIRHELELVLREAQPEKALRRAQELGVLSKLHPALKADERLSATFQRARMLTSPGTQLPSIYLALLAYQLTDGEAEDFVSFLRLPGRLAQVLRDGQRLKPALDSVADDSLSPSRVYAALQGYSPAALLAGVVVADSPVVRRNIGLFLDRFRYVRPALTGDDLKELGVAPGPGIGELLERLRAARLDGSVTTRQEERELVMRWLREGT